MLEGTWGTGQFDKSRQDGGSVLTKSNLFGSGQNLRHVEEPAQ